MSHLLQVSDCLLMMAFYDNGYLSLPWASKFSKLETQVMKEQNISGGSFSGRRSALQSERVATRQEINRERNNLLRVSSMDG